ncbi:MAG TPA: lysophospholipase [Ruminococcus sp.]|nr:lysophospholipase [Ruminococcus sp.]
MLIKKALFIIPAALLLSFPVSAEITPNPVISRDCPAYSNTGQSTAYAANDSVYYSFWFGNSPAYLAYDLSAVPENQREKIIAVWYNTTSAYDYTVLPYTSSSSMPSDYTIEVNAAEGGAYPEDNWVVADTVKDNTYHSRQHIVDMKGYNWIRINITAADGKSDGNISLNFDIHNISDSCEDSWIFYGDSITAGGMMNCYGTGFAELINQIDSNYFPAQENGGIGGIFSTDGAANIDKWLEAFPGKYVSIAYGTNDCWGNQTGAEKYYQNTAYMVEAVLKSGKIPIVPKIPYSTESGVNTYLSDYNAMIDKIYQDYPQVIKGPDFEEFFRENTDLLSADGVHPNENGYAEMRKLWAETMYERVYKQDSADKSDINGDGTVDILDITALKQYLLGNLELDINMDIHDLSRLKNTILEN